jgi:GcrA cell cycle regulator
MFGRKSTMPDQSALWPPSEVACLLHLWDRYSASQIGKKLGRTRSAICGKINRLRREGVLPAVPKQYLTNPWPPPKPKSPAAPRPMKPKPPAYAVLRQPSAGPARPLRLLDLPRKGRCRWPLGPFDRKAELFCGANTMPGQVYCPHHMRKSFSTRESKP